MLKSLNNSIGSFFDRFHHYNSQRLKAEHDALKSNQQLLVSSKLRKLRSVKIASLLYSIYRKRRPSLRALCDWLAAYLVSASTEAVSHSKPDVDDVSMAYANIIDRRAV